MKTILYVDDEDINLLIFQRNFKKHYNIIVADSGENGLEQLKNYPKTDIVISDMKMPGMDGVEFIKTVKDKNPHIPCFILTGYDLTTEIQQGIKSEMISGYFQKPLNVSKIMNAIDSVLV